MHQLVRTLSWLRTAEVVACSVVATCGALPFLSAASLSCSGSPAHPQGACAHEKGKRMMALLLLRNMPSRWSMIALSNRCPAVTITCRAAVPRYALR